MQQHIQMYVTCAGKQLKDYMRKAARREFKPSAAHVTFCAKGNDIRSKKSTVELKTSKDT